LSEDMAYEAPGVRPPFIQDSARLRGERAQRPQDDKLGSLMLDDALGVLQGYGTPALALVIFFSCLGLPVPSTMLLLAAGAFARTGLLRAELVVPLALLAAVMGDSCSYLVGRRSQNVLARRLQGSLSWRRAEHVFDRWGLWAVPLTRFLLTPLALPTNLIASGARFPFRRFVGLCLLGEALWILIFGGLGYLFASSWRTVGAFAGDLSGWLVGCALVALGVYELYEHWRHHITPARTKTPPG
jgi:membrane-associated protein